MTLEDGGPLQDPRWDPGSYEMEDIGLPSKDLLPPAGWYPVDDTTQCWWDGKKWTELYAPIGHLPVALPPWNSNATFGFGTSIVAFAFLWVPFFSILAACIGLTFSIIGSQQVARTHHRGSGLAGWGVALGLLALLFGITATVGFFA